MNIGDRMRFLRQSKNRTLDELAEALETTKTTLSRYENNKRTPDADFIICMANYYKVSSDYILGLSDNPFTINDFLKSNIGF